MKYIIFDIDGTLTDTTATDDQCFTQALEEVFHFKHFSTEYGDYTNTTDSGIIDQLFREQLGRSFTWQERNRFIRRFCELLEQAYKKQPGCISEINNAGRTLKALYRRTNLSIGLATGGWQESAQFKLRCAGIPVQRHTAASFAQDAMARNEIISDTIRKMDTYNGVKMELSEIVYIGDGNWDYLAAKQLGINFIGIENKRLDHLSEIIKISDYDHLHRHIGLHTNTIG